MKILHSSCIRVGPLSAAVVMVWLVWLPHASGQEAPATTESERIQANQLPLSGRSGQTGSVKATQTPLPGVTSGIETVSPNIQVQGTYAGRSRGASDPGGTLAFPD